MDQLYEKRGYLLDNYKLFYLKDIQGTNVNYHYHEFAKIIFMWYGKGSYSVEDQRYQIQDGDVLLIEKQKIHRPELEKDSVYERSIIYIAPEFLKYFSTQECDLEEIFESKTGHILRTKNNPKVFDLLGRFEQELSKSGFGNDVMSNLMLVQILIEIGRMIHKQRMDLSNAVMTENTRVLELMKYMDRHLTEDLSIEQIADEFYLSKYHMMRLFRQETGQSMYEYLTLRRLLKARELIAQGMNATESCYHSGFRSYSSFTRAHAKYFGWTPTGRKSRASKREATYE